MSTSFLIFRQNDNMQAVYNKDNSSFSTYNGVWYCVMPRIEAHLRRGDSRIVRVMPRPMGRDHDKGEETRLSVQFSPPLDSPSSARQTKAG